MPFLLVFEVWSLSTRRSSSWPNVKFLLEGLLDKLIIRAGPNCGTRDVVTIASIAISPVFLQASRISLLKAPVGNERAAENVHLPVRTEAGTALGPKRTLRESPEPLTNWPFSLLSRH